MFSILLNIFTAFEVLVVFNLMIIVHELGHFLAAKWRGLVIEKFGIWFGKPLWKKTIGGVEYSFGTIPFGGFVALPQMAPMEVMEGKTDTPRELLPPVSALDKIIVAFAGPLFSFLLAVLFAVIVWQVGRPVSESEATTTVGYVMPDSPASAAGIQVGDTILSVDGVPVHRFGGMGSDSISWRIVRSEGDTVPLVIQRTAADGTVTTGTYNPAPKIEPTKWWMRKSFREIGIEPMQRPMVASVLPDSPASKAGLQPNDLITAINGSTAYTMGAIADYAKTHPAPYKLTVERDGKTFDIPFAPDGALIDDVESNSPAQAAGLKKGDIITAVDGQRMFDPNAISDYIHSHGGKATEFTMQAADGTARKVSITPVKLPGESVFRIGLAWSQAMFGIVEDGSGRFHTTNPRPFEQVASGVMSIFNTLGAILSPRSSIGLQHMSGPLMMFRVYYMFFQSREGWRLALWFSVVLNVNLALINLLPIPVLDGGHITLAIVEAVRRRPVNVRFLEIVQTGCAVAILGFMLYIAYFDVQDYFGGKLDKSHFEKSATPAQTK